MKKVTQAAAIALFYTTSVFAETDTTKTIEEILVQGRTTANTLPVGTYATPISNLEYDPRIDLQSRNMAEAQADVTIRGGIFENTGFRIGSATLFDPQTGHYFAEIPVGPEMLSDPNVLTGADNALLGFNSSVGTVDFDWQPIATGGSASAGVGNNDLNLQRIYNGYSTSLTNAPDWTLGIEAEYSRSESDGTIDNGDHNYYRASGRVQLLGPVSQTDVFFGYQEKFFGWPNMYTPFGVNETENLKTRLLAVNHRQTYGLDSNFEISGYYRRHNDHYVFSRENPGAFQAFHETKVSALAISGLHQLNQAFGLNYTVQAMADEIDSTTLENNFVSRSYYKASILPEYRTDLSGNQRLTIRAGAAFDDTNRDDSDVSFIGDITWLQAHTDGSSERIYLSYAEATQVAGYTAIGGSDSGGLFRSNYDLERETAKNLELGVTLDRNSWTLDAALFYRWDNDLTDWTYSFANTAARSANAVDIETQGLEFIGIKRLNQAEIIASYTFLEKDEDYKAANIDASFYALNYPNHRVTLGAIWRPTNTLEVRVDNEWRRQEKNQLRNGDNEALFTQLTMTYSPEQLNQLQILFSVDNLWDESFEEVPGTPGRGEQYSIGATYHW
ncbi:MAG: hypothetical protein AseanaTS_12480 [Candidatus Pelagadaptatus aseana]|uniref:TonB-dependent receptor plug domain-containing protein n=1 Tax=Candidatus Pelagadaptatus aseana TaxID=3120508 RepID=UPI0039B32C7C